MSISFPQVPDVTLKTPPLVKVICQVRFAPILQIASDKLADYQELIRNEFPKFVKSTPIQFELKNIGALSAARLPNEFIFESADSLSSVSLGVDFVALSTEKYSSWKTFEKDLNTVLETFEQIYGLALSTRIGLRYINALNFTNTEKDSLKGLVSCLNSDLLKFENKTWGIPEKVVNFVLLREEEEFLALRTSIESMPEPQIILDYDYYTELETPTKMTKNSLLKKFNHYHQRIYNAFRWSIREGEINIFQPFK